MNFSNINQSNSSTKKNLLFASYNQLNDCVIFGTNTGFYVYTLVPFKKIIARRITGGVSIVKMLFKSNIVIFVGNVEKGLYPNNKLIIWDDHKREVIGEIAFKTKILNIELTKKIIVVVCVKKIYIYNFQNLVLIKSIETGQNIKGLCSITDDENNFIAFPSGNLGQITISKCSSDYLKSISAHLSDIELFAFDSSGKYIVSASEKGTLLRIYDLESTTLVKELRRGSDQVNIVDLKFSPDNKYLLCSSCRGTIHIFYTNINNNDNSEDNEVNNSLGYGTYYVSSYLPSYFSSEWSFTQFYLKDIISYSLFNKDNEIITIGNNGCFYTLTFNDNDNKIESTYKFVSDEDDPFNDRTSTIK